MELDLRGYKMVGIEEAMEEVRGCWANEDDWIRKHWYRTIYYDVVTGEIDIRISGWLGKSLYEMHYDKHHGVYNDHMIEIVFHDEIAKEDILDAQDLVDRIVKQIREIEELCGMPVVEVCKNSR